MSAKATSPKKSTTKSAKSKTVAKAASHPPFADIIRECIVDAGDRTGVSRPTIKKYIEEKYKMEVTASVISNINRSIAYGAEKGTFVLPKGPSGKVKLAPKKSTSDAAKENKPTKPAAPAKKTPVKAATKLAKKTAATKKTTMTKKPLAKKTTAKPAAKKTAAKRAPAKKSLTGTAKVKPATKTRSPPKKKTSSAAAPPSKRKTASAKPASKAASKAAPSAKLTSPKK